MKEERNCDGKSSNESFRYQFKTFRNREEEQDSFIKECPQSYIFESSRLFWDQYQDVKVKKELGLIMGDIREISFQAFKNIMFASQDYDEYERKKPKPKKRKAPRKTMGR